MKTAKKLTAILLCIAMLLGIGATSAFALEIGDNIEWSGPDWCDTYIYSGTLKEGAQDVEGGDDYDTDELCYEFTAEKDGYYKITVYGIEIPFVCIADSFTNSTASGMVDYIWYCDETENDVERKEYCIYNLSKGTYLVGMRFNIENPAACDVRVDYIAESITDVTYDESKYQDLIIGYDVYEDDEYYDPGSDYAVTFSNGETLKLDYDYSGSLRAKVNKSWVEGENKLTLILPGYEKEITATAYEITHFVKDIEIPNIEKYLVSYKWYNGFGYYEFGETEEDVIITYTDGTKKTFNYYFDEENDIYNTEITLPNGKEIYLYAYQVNDRAAGKRFFIAGIAEHNFIDEECEIVTEGFAANLILFTENIGKHFEWHFEELSWYIEELKYSNTIEGIMYYLGRIFGSQLFENIRYEISDFTGYYF